MSWESFYPLCFLVGFFFSLVSFVAGFGFTHVPGLHVHTGHVGGHSSPVNFGTVAAFLAWFGGTGYLLTRYSSLWFAMGLGIALMSGLLGGGIVFLFLSKVLTSEGENMDPADYEMVGVLGRTSMSIRE